MSSKTNAQFLGASVTEFISVWALGGKADLNLSTNNGVTTVGFTCTLGNPGALHSLPSSHAPSPPPSFPPRRPRHRGPSERKRNQERAARHQAALAKTTVPASAATSSSSLTDSVMSSSSNSSATEPVLLPVTTETSFKCNHCEESFKTDKGLRIHIGKVHKHFPLKTPEKERSISIVEEPNLTLTPSKLLGREESEEIFDQAEKSVEHEESKNKVEPCPFCPENWYSKENGYCQCGKCEDCETMSTQIGIDIHILNEHEPSLVWRHFGKDWVMKYKHFVYGTQDPNWNKTWRSLNVL